MNTGSHLSKVYISDTLTESPDTYRVESPDSYRVSSSKETLRIWAIFLFGKCGHLTHQKLSQMHGFLWRTSTVCALRMLGKIVFVIVLPISGSCQSMVYSIYINFVFSLYDELNGRWYTGKLSTRHNKHYLDLDMTIKSPKTTLVYIIIIIAVIFPFFFINI